MRKISLIIYSIFLSASIFGQVDTYNKADLHPVSPTAFQFLKYIEMPVSEYTGIPDISIPLYEINVDGVKVPLQLTYHGGGIRVSEEASWVGLGWDLQLGSIVQTINDRDDFGKTVLEDNVKKRPDFFAAAGDGSPTILPMYHKEPSLSIHGLGWTDPYPISQPLQPPLQPLQGYAIATNYYVPVNGQFSQQETAMFTQKKYDSEPDIFVANFMGETVKFTVDFNTGNLIVLNKRGYKVEKTANGFTITPPSGAIYFFEFKSTIQNSTTTSDIDYYISTSPEDATHIYFLTKIQTVNNRIITFDYYQTAEFSGYTTLSTKTIVPGDSSTNNHHPIPMGYGDYQYADIDARPGTPWLGIINHDTYSVNIEHYTYLKSITFPNGKVNFQVSDRTDITGGKKLDTVLVSNSDGIVINSWALNYSYFDASTVSGNGYQDPAVGAETRSSLRLKLNNLTSKNGAVHTFTYNSTLLPKKNSFAQDYWGFYNGQLSNSSLAPNPIETGYPELGDNGNNRTANLNSARAGILESIQYPTGGKVVFEYSLNEFDKDQIVGIVSSAPQIISGDGLRISAIYHYSSGNVLASKTIYSYEDGKLVIPLRLARQFGFSKLVQFDMNNCLTEGYYVTEISANGIFSTNPLCSASGVGYSKVTKQTIDQNNVSEGKIVTEFYNSVAVHNPTISARAHYCDVPYLKRIDLPDNGTVMSVSYFDKLDNPVKTIVNNYSIWVSPITYGARIMPYSSLYFGLISSGTLYDYVVPRNMIGYYPIYDIESKLVSTTTTERDENGTELSSTATYSYDSFGQLISQQTRTSSDQYQFSSYIHGYDYYSDPAGNTLLARNRLTEIANMHTEKREPNYTSLNNGASYDNEYALLSDKVVLSKTTINKQLGFDAMPNVITYDQYDPSTANLLQYTDNGLVKSIFWDYNHMYVTAEVTNAAYSLIGYTSFETEEKGTFSFNGTSVLDLTAPTGLKVYDLANGNITKSGLDNKTYIVSYWSNSGSKNVNGTSPTTGRSVNGWVYYKHKVSNPSGGVITVSGSGRIDELRLYPQGALMTTYTYKPLIGIISECDANNRIKYYEYDNTQRLILIRDQDKNIVKKFCYNYAGQPESCNIFYSAAKSDDFTRNDCGPSAYGSTVTYAVPAGAYSSSISQADADQKAQDDVDANGQAYANANGTCTMLGGCVGCKGFDRKCIDNICEFGFKVYTDTYYDAGTNQTVCVYHYEFSNGSWSSDLNEYHAGHGTFCIINE